MREAAMKGPGRGVGTNLRESPRLKHHSPSPSLNGLLCPMETTAALPRPKERFEVVGSYTVLSKCEARL